MPRNAEGHERQCVARAKERDAEGEVIYGPDDKPVYRRCRKFANKFTTVCNTHGGATRQVKEAARARGEYMRDSAMERLIEALENQDDEVAVKAIAVALRYAPPLESADPAEALRTVLARLDDAMGEDDESGTVPASEG